MSKFCFSCPQLIYKYILSRIRKKVKKIKINFLFCRKPYRTRKKCENLTIMNEIYMILQRKQPKIMLATKEIKEMTIAAVKDFRLRPAKYTAPI